MVPAVAVSENRELFSGVFSMVFALAFPLQWKWVFGDSLPASGFVLTGV